MKQREERIEDMMLILSEVQKRMRQGQKPYVSKFCKELRMSPFSTKLIPGDLAEVEVTPQMAIDVLRSIRERQKAQNILRKQKNPLQEARRKALENIGTDLMKENSDVSPKRETQPSCYGIKKCGKCGRTLPISSFYWNSKRMSYSYWCKECKRKREDSTIHTVPFDPKRTNPEDIYTAKELWEALKRLGFSGEISREEVLK